MSRVINIRNWLNRPLNIDMYVFRIILLTSIWTASQIIVMIMFFQFDNPIISTVSVTVVKVISIVLLFFYASLMIFFYLLNVEKNVKKRLENEE